jgi:hypothetical protein
MPTPEHWATVLTFIIRVYLDDFIGAAAITADYKEDLLWLS